LLESEVEQLFQNHRGPFLGRDSTHQKRRCFKGLEQLLTRRGIVGPARARADKLAAVQLVDPEVGCDAEKMGARALHLGRLRAHIASAPIAPNFPLCPGPIWWTLLKKRANPFLRVTRHRVKAHDFLGVVIGARLVEVDLGVECLLADRDGERTRFHDS
jgi:hypothetical protein